MKSTETITGLILLVSESQVSLVSVVDVQNLKTLALFCFVCCWFPLLSPDCPGTHYVVQSGLKQTGTYMPASAS